LEAGQFNSTPQADTGRRSASDQLRERLVGATLGRFDIYAELGRGGMAAVFLALDLALDRKVAIKVMLPEVATGPAAVERFRREARVAASLSHPQIIPVYAVGDTPDLAWFVMKYVEGQSLDSVLLSEGAQSPAFVQAMLQQVGGALEYAHRRGVVHRDIKPANILLDEGGWFVLTDFGIAKATDDLGLTSSGMIIVTPTYMSPEHFTGVEVGPPADQYALGCVAYELLTGIRPFERKTVAELMKAHMLDDAPPLAEKRADCPAGLAACVTRMLAKDREARFGSLGDAIHSLDPASPDAMRVVTTQITTLARSGAANRPRISVPLSPIPVNRSLSTSSGGPVVNTEKRAGALLRGLLASVAVFAGGVLATQWWINRTVTPEATAGASPTSVSADTVRRDVPAYGIARDSTRAGTTSAYGTASASAVREPRANDRPSSNARPAQDGRVNTDKSSKRPPETSEMPSTAGATVPPSQMAVASMDTTPAPLGGTLAVPPPTPPSAPAFLQIGTRIRGAVLYIDRVLHVMPTGERRYYQVTPGAHDIQVTTNSCDAPYRETISFAPGDTVRRNYKNPPCG
jgi:serine/threonine-protein kinase